MVTFHVHRYRFSPRFIIFIFVVSGGAGGLPVSWRGGGGLIGRRGGLEGRRRGLKRGG